MSNPVTRTRFGLTKKIVLTNAQVILPVASVFASAFQAGGAFAGTNLDKGEIQASAGEAKVSFNYTAVDVGIDFMGFTFGYSVI